MNSLSTVGLVRLGAVVVAVASLAAGIGGWVALDVVDATVALAPDLRRVGEPSSDLIEGADATLEEVRVSLMTVGDIADRVADSSGDAADVLAEVARLSTGRIPETLEALQEGLPALVDTAAVIDDTMRTLGVLGVEYRPQVPLDEAFEEVETQLQGLPDSIRAQGTELEALAEEIRAAGDDTALLTERIDTIEQNLADAQATMDDYDAAVGSLNRLTELGERVGSLMPVGRVSLVIMALTGLALGATGWQLANRLAD